ncbi:SGNH/GDSL hydrolase family protein [Metabacillus indicus]|uniref:SGNH/GDSL hydrolase family protein n=1 Tax=Metabacillus indicus TaxID=246786 RepID=UPI0031741D40
MRKSFLALTGLCLMLAGCDVFSAKPANMAMKPEAAEDPYTKKPIPSDFIESNLNVVAVGDSLTAGVGDADNNGGYVGDVSDLLQLEEEVSSVDVSNFGVRGHKTNDLLKVLGKRDVIEKLREADIILMTIGGNDIMKVTRNHIMDLQLEPYREEQPRFEKRFKKILNSIRSANPDAVIVYTGLYNPFKFMLPELSEIDTIVEEWNQASNRMIMADGNAIFVPTEDLFATRSYGKLLYVDEFHPSETGYSLIADRVYTSLSEQNE